MPKLTFRKILLGVLILVILLLARPVGYLTCTWLNDAKADTTTKQGYVNDASHLNETAVDSVIKVAADPEIAANQLAELIKTVSATGKKISIAGAQHSMGGHSIYPGGIMIDMKPFDRIDRKSVV